MDKYQGEIVKCLHNYHAWTRSSITAKYAEDEPGSADLMVHINGKGTAVEVKTGKDNCFDFNNFRPNQREWAELYQRDTKCIYWIAFVIESEYSPYTSLRIPRVAFLVPYIMIISTIESIKSIQSTLPYYAGKGYNISMQESHSDMKHMWKDYELSWSKGWRIPTWHSFYSLYNLSEIEYTKDTK